MTRDQKASILGEIIRLAREGKNQSAIASSIGINPGKVYKICKKYGIKTRHILHKKKETGQFRPVQCLLPL